jgi:hypothetical protein
VHMLAMYGRNTMAEMVGEKGKVNP